MHRTARARTAALAAAALAGLLIIGIDGWPGAATGQNGDCETVGAGVLAQPVAAWTSLAFLPLGVWASGYRALRPPMAMLFAAGFVAVGLGSFAGHAAATDWARGWDSLAIKALLVPFAVYPLARRGTLPPTTTVAAAAAIVALLWLLESIVPDAGRPLLAVTAAAAILGAVAGGDRKAVAVGGALLGAGGVLWWLGRSGGPLCDEGSILQAHGMWHILAAGGFLAVYRGFNDH